MLLVFILILPYKIFISNIFICTIWYQIVFSHLLTKIWRAARESQMCYRRCVHGSCCLAAPASSSLSCKWLMTNSLIRNRSLQYKQHFYRPLSRGDNTFGSVRVCACVSVRLFVCVRVRVSVWLWALSCLNRLTFDPDFWHEGWPWPWLAWICSRTSKVKVKQWKITLPFEPVVRSRSILGLGVPSSGNGNCEWPLPVHLNSLLVCNQRAFNVSRVSGRSAFINPGILVTKFRDFQD